MIFLYRTKCRFVLMLFFILSITSCTIWAQEKQKDWKFTHGYWQETRPYYGDSSYNYTIFTYKKASFRFDNYNVKSGNKQKYWINYGKFDVLKAPGTYLNIDPGVTLDSRANWLYGANIRIGLFNERITVYDQSYWGKDKKDNHVTFYNVRPCKYGTIQYYRFAQTGCRPECYIGPKIDLGKEFSVWYGFSTNDSTARALQISGWFRF